MKKEILKNEESISEVKPSLPSKKYKLVSSDKKIDIEANEATYIVWKANGTFASTTNTPSIGTSLALDLIVGESAAYVTDTIVEIAQTTDKLVKFKTNNTAYELVVQK